MDKAGGQRGKGAISALAVAMVLMMAACAGPPGGSAAPQSGLVGMVERLAGSLRLPPGHNFHGWEMAFTKNMISEHGSVTRDQVLGAMRFVQLCQWDQYWLEGFAGQDGASMKSALRMMKILTQATPPKAGRGYLERLNRQAQGGGPALVRRFVAINCSNSGY